MRSRRLYAVALVLLLMGCGIVLFALPTKYGCTDGSPAFTTSKSAAYDSCVGGVTGGVVKDRRVRDRAATIALVVFVDALLSDWHPPQERRTTLQRIRTTRGPFRLPAQQPGR
jgi:hypothetical protein